MLLLGTRVSKGTRPLSKVGRSLVKQVMPYARNLDIIKDLLTRL